MPEKYPRVATADDVPAPPLTVAEAVLRGSRLDQLVAMRRIAAAAIDSPETSPRDLKALMLSVNEFSKEIEQLRASLAEEARDAEVANGVISTKWRPEAI
ncbi:hypothetical protein LJ753_16790 [Arthrobacter sp. zg-Y20]|uniref:hypothetical protein n=1 Tax=unclassified Arthrobacter TaxID=235627 RepID=UPI001D13BB80|nr:MULTISPECIES: hypothetical protein [unclassified Arthrobacter]MCC3277523.1 hypothetical protein [Arthrobacter sp. zg-Y20]MDK1317681.1 hypothetical protein [Arthrobacter sp. zg.Y20]WIB07060.1 hypothetical protein QNO06_04850 [Arthrobacter sp. zg-Y20]